MPPRLRVQMSDLLHGWLTLEIASGDTQLTYAVSHIFPSLLELADVIRHFAEPPVLGVESHVRWCLEPGELVMTFRRIPPIIHLSVSERPRHVGAGELLLEATGDYAAIILPFWRAMRRLIGTYPREYIEQHWRDFPFDSLPQERPVDRCGKR